MARALSVLREGVPDDPVLDTAVSRQLLHAVSLGEHPESFRLWQPGDALAFSSIDPTRPGFARAVAAARELGFTPFLRLAGGRPAVYARSILAFAWTRPAPDLRHGVQARFDELSDCVVAALAKLGVDARRGEVPGEFCPGEHSVNARGRVKLMGVGQRVVRGAAHVGGVIVVRDEPRVRRVLERVYAALDLALDPASFGSVEEEGGDASFDDVAEALLDELGRRYALEPGRLAPGVLRAAGRLASEVISLGA